MYPVHISGTEGSLYPGSSGTAHCPFTKPVDSIGDSPCYIMFSAELFFFRFFISSWYYTDNLVFVAKFRF